MKKSLKNAYLFLVSTCIIASSALANRTFEGVRADGNNANADFDYGAENGTKEYADAPSNMRQCNGSAGTDKIFQDDRNEISKSKYDTISYDGGTYNRITDENMNKIGNQDSSEREKRSWSGFLGLGSGNCYISDFCCVYARYRDKYLANDVKIPRYDAEYAYAITKTNSIEMNVSTDAKIGTGFGGFVKAGISFHFETSVGLESTFTTGVTYKVTDDFVSRGTFLCAGMIEHYVEYIVVRFSHKVKSGGLYAPTLTLYMVPTIEVRRQLLDVETFCFEGGRI